MPTDPKFRPLYPALKMVLVPMIAAFPILEDGDLQNPKTYLKAGGAACVALYALACEPPRISKRVKPTEE